MNNYDLQQTKFWIKLPWQKINARIFVLQQKILQSSKSCKKHELYKWQNILLNSKEMRIEAINTVCKLLIQEYLKYNNKKYFISHRLKLFLFKNLFKYYSNNYAIKNLLNRIIQYIIYVCLKSEWEAKTEPILGSNFSIFSKNAYKVKYIDFILKYDFDKYKQKTKWEKIEYQILYKYLSISLLTTKLNSLFYINYCFKLWLNQSFLKEVKLEDNSICLSFDRLFSELINQIVLTGIQWFNFKNLELDSIIKRYNFTGYLNFLYDSFTHYSIYVINNKKFFSIADFFISSLNFIDHKMYVRKYIQQLDLFNPLYIKQYVSTKDTYDCLIKSLVFYFTLNLRKFFYNKDKLGHLKIKNYINIKNILNSIESYILMFYTLFSLILKYKNLKDIINYINIFIKNFFKKKFFDPKGKFNISYNSFKKKLFLIKYNIIYSQHLLIFNK